ncbi:MAG: hypothetical protein WA946_00010 [Nitrospirota bacterium]
MMIHDDNPVRRIFKKGPMPLFGFVELFCSLFDHGLKLERIGFELFCLLFQVVLESELAY